MDKTRLRGSAVCREQGRLLIVRMRDPSTLVTFAFPPGGGVEEGETPAQTAARETLEETGLRVKVDEASVRVVEYPYRWDGHDVAITTHYFLATLEEPFVETIPAVEDASYNLGAEWLPVSEAIEAMPPIIGLPVSEMLVRRR